MMNEVSMTASTETYSDLDLLSRELAWAVGEWKAQNQIKNDGKATTETPEQQIRWDDILKAVCKDLREHILKHRSQDNFDAEWLNCLVPPEKKMVFCQLVELCQIYRQNAIESSMLSSNADKPPENVDEKKNRWSGLSRAGFEFLFPPSKKVVYSTSKKRQRIHNSISGEMRKTERNSISTTAYNMKGLIPITADVYRKDVCNDAADGDIEGGVGHLEFPSRRYTETLPLRQAEQSNNNKGKQPTTTGFSSTETGTSAPFDCRIPKDLSIASTDEIMASLVSTLTSAVCSAADQPNFSSGKITAQCSNSADFERALENVNLMDKKEHFVGVSSQPSTQELEPSSCVLLQSFGDSPVTSTSNPVRFKLSTFDDNDDNNCLSHLSGDASKNPHKRMSLKSESPATLPFVGRSVADGLEVSRNETALGDLGSVVCQESSKCTVDGDENTLTPTFEAKSRSPVDERGITVASSVDTESIQFKTDSTLLEQKMAKKNTKAKDKLQTVQSSLTVSFRPAQKQPSLSDDARAEGNERSLIGSGTKQKGQHSEQAFPRTAMTKQTLLKKRIDACAVSKRICNQVERYLVSADDINSLVQRDSLLLASNGKKEQHGNCWIQLNDAFIAAAFRGGQKVGSLRELVEAAATSNLVETRKGDDDEIWICRRKPEENLKAVGVSKLRTNSVAALPNFKLKPPTPNRWQHDGKSRLTWARKKFDKYTAHTVELSFAHQELAFLYEQCNDDEPAIQRAYANLHMSSTLRRYIKKQKDPDSPFVGITKKKRICFDAYRARIRESVLPVVDRRLEWVPKRFDAVAPPFGLSLYHQELAFLYEQCNNIKEPMQSWKNADRFMTTRLRKYINEHPEDERLWEHVNTANKSSVRLLFDSYRARLREKVFQPLLASSSSPSVTASNATGTLSNNILQIDDTESIVKYTDTAETGQSQTNKVLESPSSTPSSNS